MSSASSSRLSELTILHVSGTRLGDADSDAREGLTLLHQDIANLAKEHHLRPDLLVVTGDLTANALPGEYSEAMLFLDGLDEATDIPRRHVAIVPGSNDVNRQACQAYFLGQESQGEEPVPPYFPKWAQFARAFTEFYAEDARAKATFTPDEPWTLFEMPDLGVVIAGLNSTMAESHRAEDRYGFVGEAQLTWFADRLSDYRSRGWLRLLAVNDGHPRDSAALDRALRETGLVTMTLAGQQDAPASRFEFRTIRHDVPAERDESTTAALATTGSTRRDNSFLERVTEATRVRFPGAIVTERPEANYLRVTAIRDGGGAEQWPVGVIDGPPSEAAIDGFADGVHAQFAAADSSVLSELVYQGVYASAALIDSARRRGIRLRSFSEYQGLLDLTPLAARQAERLASDRVYPEGLYVEQRFRVVAGGGSPDEIRTGLIRQVVDWLGAEDQRLIVVLGDFGQGKTAFLRQLTRFLPETLPGVTPVLIELRTLEKAPTLDELLAQHLVRQGVGDFSAEKLRYMIESGRVALLFDGFDELELRVGYDNAADYLRTLLASAGGRAKAVLTGRTQHFRSTGQVRTALGDGIETRAGSRVVLLEEFADKQIREYLVRLYNGDEDRARRRLDLISGLGQLLELMHNPRMLAFAAFLDEDRLRAALSSHGQASAAALYEQIIDFWLSSETARATHHHGLPAITMAERFDACIALALRMWRSGRMSISLDDLSAEVSDALVRLSERGFTQEQAAHSVASGSLLIRADDGSFSFIHQSVMEWLVAVAAVRSAEVLGDRPMSALMTSFFADLAGVGEADGWARATLAATGAPPAAKLNALALLDRLAPADAAQDLSGIELRHADLSGRDLSGAGLRDSNLRGMRLDGVDLSGADLTGADLRGVVMTGGSLRGATLTGSRWERSVILGTDGLDEPQIAQAPELAPAAIAGRDTAEVMLAGPAGAVRCIACSPDGSLLAHGSGSLVTITDAVTGYALRILSGHRGEVSGVAFSPDGTLIATASSDRTARVWDTTTGLLLNTLTGHDRPVNAISWSPDGALLATASSDRTARFWDTTTGRPIYALAWHQRRVYGIAFSPDGRFIATASQDGAARIWSVPVADPRVMRSVDLTTRFTSHDGPVNAIAYSPDGAHITTASNDGTAHVWDTATSQHITTLTGHDGPVTAIAYSPDGRFIATASNDGTARVWSADDGSTRNTLAARGGAVTAVAFVPGGDSLAAASSDGVVRLWDTAAGQQRMALGRNAGPRLTSVTFGTGLIAAASDDGTARVWDTATGQHISTLACHERPVNAVAFSPDGIHIATASDDRTVRLWDTAAGTERSTIAEHNGPVNAVAFSPDGALLATASDDFKVDVLDTATGQGRVRNWAHPGRVYALAFSPDGRYIATASHDRVVRLLDVGTGAIAASLDGHDGPVTALAFSPDGTLIAAASNQVVYFWSGPRSSDHLPSQRRRALHTDTIRAVAFSPDGSLLATASNDATARLWSVPTGTTLAILAGHSGPVTSVAFSPDGTVLATTSEDGALRLWEVGTSAVVATLIPFPDGGQAVLLPDGRYKIDGDPGDWLWWAMKLCRFAPGELDPYLPEIRRLPADEPILPPRGR